MQPWSKIIKLDRTELNNDKSSIIKQRTLTKSDQIIKPLFTITCPQEDLIQVSTVRVRTPRFILSPEALDCHSPMKIHSHGFHCRQQHLQIASASTTPRQTWENLHQQSVWKTVCQTEILIALIGLCFSWKMTSMEGRYSVRVSVVVHSWKVCSMLFNIYIIAPQTALRLKAERMVTSCVSMRFLLTKRTQQSHIQSNQKVSRHQISFFICIFSSGCRTL